MQAMKRTRGRGRGGQPGWNEPVPEGGKALCALLLPLAKIGQLDGDFARFARLSDEDAATELRGALSALPELRRTFAVRVLMQVMRAMLDGAGWPWME